MAVYEALLEKLSGGEVISSEGTGGYFTDRGINITRFHKTGVDGQAGWVLHQFVDIGGTRIQNVALRPYQNALLEEALGQEIALSMIGAPADSSGRHVVVAIRTPKGGIDRPGKNLLLGSSAFLVLKHWLLAPFVFLMFLLFAWLASVVYSPLWSLGLVVAVGVTIWWMVVPFIHARRAFRAAAALDKPPWNTMARRS